MKNVEIERKFLVDKKLLTYLIKENIPYQKKSLKQYYTKISEEKTVRYRKSDKNYFLTIKSGRGHSRGEIEKEISKKKFEANKAAMKGFLIEKKRYEFTLNKHFYEFDIFSSPVDDLALLESEFQSEEAYESYEIDPALKPFFIKDVSDDFRYTNASLSLFKVLKEKKKSKKLKPYCQSGEVLSTVLCQYVENILDYKKRIVKEYHDEDLHQMRINLRKSRALIGKMGAVFEREKLSFYDEQLSMIAKKTNKKRDLDVFIQAFEAHFADNVRDELRFFYHDINQQRVEEEERLKAYLKSDALEGYFKNWKSFLKDVSNLSKKAEEPIALFLEESIDAILKTIKKKIKKYKRNNHEEHLHKVRISFKKLRYILESFEPLFQKEKIQHLLKRVKKLQNDLGDFNDLCVQHAFLAAYLAEHKIVRENESSFDSFLSELESAKAKLQKKIEADIEESIDMQVLREDLQVRFT